PGAEELAPRLLDDRIVEGPPRGRLLQHDLADVRRIDGYPPAALVMELGPAMLGLAHVPGSTEALELLRLGDPEAEDLARRDARRPRQADEEGVEVGALAAQVPCLEHRLDVPEPAPPHLGIAEGVLDDPLVDGAGLLAVG